VSQVDRTAPGWTDHHLGISVFVEKPDLQPFGEAKLYGHNAGHALAAYLANGLGLTRIDELSSRPDVVEYVRAAMIEESGAPLCRRHAGVDPLFTPAGFKEYVDDLIVRMVNPYVRDTVERVGRDPARKLRWDDRLVGAMRHALASGVEPVRYAVGCAAALDWLGITPERTTEFLRQLWQLPADAEVEAQQVVARVELGWGRLAHWKVAGFPAVVAEDGNL
jgi:mannitol-1-phosphate 5-dehydrogenase